MVIVGDLRLDSCYLPMSAMMMLKRTRQTIKADNRSKNKLDFIILGRGAYVAQKRLEKANWAKLTRQRRPDRVFGGHLRCDGQLIGCVRSTIYHVRDREEAGWWETERTVVKVAAVRPGLILLSGGLIWLGGHWANGPAFDRHSNVMVTVFLLIILIFN